MNKNIVTTALILFIEGLVSLSYQMLYIRQIGTNIGNSVDIVSWIIGLFLIALAVGYKIGGTFKGNYEDKLCSNLTRASFIALIGLSYIFIDLFFNLFGILLGQYTAMILYCFVIVVPATYFLGQTLPLMTNRSVGNTVSEISGNILFLSTIGSFLGAVITTNILLRFLGVAYTLMLISISLVLLNYILIKERTKVLKNTLYLIFISGLSIININYEKNNFVTTNQYASYKSEILINKKDPNKEIKIFRSNNSYSSLLYKDTKTSPEFNTIGYIKMINDFLFVENNFKNKDILVIGAGGFVMSYGVKDNNFSFVDIDPQIKEIAEKSFLKRNINGKFIAMDGRGYVNSSKDKFDIVVSDAYSGARSIPESLTTYEYFKKLKNITKEDGWIILNIISSPSFSNTFSKNMNLTIQKALGSCYTKISDYSKEMTNIIYLCKNVSSENIYTDDKVNSNSEYFKATENKMVIK